MTKAKQAGKARAAMKTPSNPAAAAPEPAKKPRAVLRNPLGAIHHPADVPIHDGDPITEHGDKHEAGTTVTVTVPKHFTLTLDDHSPVPYRAGVQEMPAEHANHWWSKVQGVEVYQPRKV